MRSSRAERTAAGRTLSRRSATAAQRRHARRVIDTAKRDAQDAGTRAAREVRDAPLPNVTRRQIWRAGDDPDAARAVEEINAMRSRFPGDAEVAHASRNAEALRRTSAGAHRSALGATALDQGGERLAGEPYQSAKGHFTREVGSTW